MQFDQLCALVGALRDRVADLEAKEAARSEREAAIPVDFHVDLTGTTGNAEIQAMVAKGVQAGVASSRNRFP